ncbi:MAG: EamA family transporter, partial [Chloroflexi bacterium]|nr:EamA family transporter [Chloroflexota bacterium]
AASRLTLFLGVKHLGSLQAALLSVGEMLVTVILAMVWLDETLTMMQIAGALLLITSILLVKYEQNIPNFDWWAILYKRWAQRG